MDKHLLAGISIAGTSLDFLGGMYLAYDLLGGKNGPLRTLTRAVTYGMLFGVGYGLAFGIVFGIAGGLSHAVSLSLEYARASRGEDTPGIGRDALFSAIRAVAFGIGTAWIFGARFGWTFGALSWAGQIVAYRFGIRPTMDYHPQTKPRMTRGQLLSVINRTAGYGIAGCISGVVASQGSRSVGLGLRMGITVGLVTAVAIALSPWIEWTAENAEDRRLGTFGIGLILTGFVLQSVQYWAVLFDVPVR